MTSNLEKYKKGLKRLINSGGDLFDDLTKNKDKASVFHSGYQKWYSEGQEVIRQILPNRFDKFNQLYYGDKRKNINISTYTIKDWLLGIRASVDDFTVNKRFDDFSVAAMRFQS